MNHPNYFLADLPPEAELTPRLITDAVRTLQRNRARFLLPRPTEEIIRVLCDVAADWQRPGNIFREQALADGPAQTGFSRPVLERGLDNFFAPFTPENFTALLEQELGHPGRLDDFTAATAPPGAGHSRPALALGPALLTHIAAGNLPNPALMSLTLGLLLRSAQFMKCASGAAFLPRLFAHSIYAHDRKLGACLEVAEWTGGRHALEDALYAETGVLTATGSDETLAAIRRRLPDRVRFVGYGRRLSFGLVTREVLQEDAVGAVLAAAADDIVAWDQQGCLSPHVLYVEERGKVDADVFASRLATELAAREAVHPRGGISANEAAAIASRRALYETLQPHRGDVKLWQSPASTAWTVVYEHDHRFQISCLNRFVYVKPVPDLETLLQGIDDVRAQLSTVGLAATPGRAKEIALRLAREGVLRICPLGRMQIPPLSWRHDGRPPLGDLVTWVDWES